MTATWDLYESAFLKWQVKLVREYVTESAAHLNFTELACCSSELSYLACNSCQSQSIINNQKSSKSQIWLPDQNKMDNKCTQLLAIEHNWAHIR